MDGALSRGRGHRRRALARRRPRPGAGGGWPGDGQRRRVTGSNMRDKMGRPIVVVTGSGIVTSLGAGKADNWKRLTAGESGIRAITRFPTDSLKTKIAGTVDFVPVEPLTRRPNCRSASPSSPSRRRSPEAGIGAPRPFPGSAVSRGGADRARMAAARGARRKLGRQRRGRAMTICCAPPRPAGSADYHSASCSARSAKGWRRSSAPRARRFRSRPPAPRARARSSSASRRSGAAKPTPRCALRPTARSIRRA